MKWFTVEEAALFSSTSPSALRASSRGARHDEDGGTEANLDGVRGKKLGVSWRVAFSSRWLDEPEVKRPRGP